MLIVLCSSCKESTEDEKAMQQMVERLFPEYASQFSFEQSEKIDKDWYEIEAQGGTVRIRGNNANSMAVGLNYYLNHYCLTSVSWYVNDTVEMPEVLPMPPAKIISTARCKNRFFLNYCTFGYTMPLGTVDRLDGFKWNQYAFGNHRTRICLVSRMDEIRIDG